MTTQSTPPIENDWVPSVTAVHNDLLGRDPDQEALAYWCGALDSGLTFEQMYHALRNCDERKTAKATSDWGPLVTNVHIDLLGREPDEGGLSYWTQALSTGLKFETMYLAIRNCEERMTKPPEIDWSGLVKAVHNDLLIHDPDEDALAYWINALQTGVAFEKFYTAIRNSDERKSAAPLWVFPGHYYSPIASLSLLNDSKDKIFQPNKNILGINLNEQFQIDLVEHLEIYYKLIPFTDEKSDTNRYYYNNIFFGYGDAILLSCIIQYFRPNKIVEVGSGFSSAVILDTLDYNPDIKTTSIFIEPYTERLESLLKDNDRSNVEIIPKFVQDVDLDIFSNLSKNDILFIDSTHVVKTGSDVLYHITHTLPSLKAGAIIHFHDIFYPFEYPETWVLEENRSWNEIYFLQAFLMDNEKYEILFFNDYMAKRHPELMRQKMPKFMALSGGSLWLRKVSE